MDKHQFWQLIEAAREQERDLGDGEHARAVARRASELLAGRAVEEIVAAQQVFWDLMAESYTSPLWAAAYLTNGGCSDDAFTIRYEALDPDWGFDFDDQDEMTRRLPRLAALYF
ncbi:DUF4240 domain-containing protein [Streptomyces niveus]|uniref:DUF4240 domain-containing protein n=1 Tax=Streptomyces niveus TaxID=193462 RepID=UPI003655BA08